MQREMSSFKNQDGAAQNAKLEAEMTIHKTIDLFSCSQETPDSMPKCPWARHWTTNCCLEVFWIVSSEWFILCVVLLLLSALIVITSAKEIMFS